MVFTIMEIGNKTELLPGIKFGYQIHESGVTAHIVMRMKFQPLNDQIPLHPLACHTLLGPSIFHQ